MKMKLRMTSSILCISMLLVIFASALPTSAAAVDTTNNTFLENANQARQMMKEAKEQAENQDYTPLAAPAKHKILWLGFNKIRYNGGLYTMNSAQQTIFRNAAAIFKNNAETYSNNNVQIENTIHFVNDELALEDVGANGRVTVRPEHIQSILNEIAPVGTYDSIMVTAAVGKLPCYLGVTLSNYACNYGYAFFPIDHTAIDASIINEKIAEIAMHEWIHVLDGIFTSMGIDFPYADWAGPTSEKPEYYEYYNGELPLFYEDVLKGNVDYEGKKIGMFPKMWNITPRSRIIGTYYLENTASQKCLTISDPATWTASNHPVNQQYLTSGSQRWRMAVLNEDEFDIAPVSHPTYRLDLYNGNAANGNNIEVWESSSYHAQQWKFYENGNNTYRIVTNRDESKCMTMYNTSNANLKLYTYSGLDAQQWNIIPADITEGLRCSFYSCKIFFDYVFNRPIYSS